MYRLIDAIQVPVPFVSWMTGKNGVPKTCRGRLVPNREYTEYEDDPVFVKSLKDLHTRFDWSKDLEDACVRCGAKYVIPKRTCSCHKKKIDIWYVEVME